MRVFTVGAILLASAALAQQTRLPRLPHQGPDLGPTEPLEPAFHVHCEEGFAAGFPCDGVDLLAFLPLKAVGGDPLQASDLWGWTDSGSGREFVLLGLEDGTSFVEITDPTNPLYLGKLRASAEPSHSRDIKVDRDRAYNVSEARGHGMQVFDLTELLSVVTPPVRFAATGHYSGNGLSTSHNIAISEETGFAYIVGSNTCRGGLHMIDLRGEGGPRFAGCDGSDGYVHDAQCVVYRGPDASYQGREICFSINEDTLTIVDVTEKRAPRQIARTSYQGVSYMHQGWSTEDHLYLLTNDEGDEIDFQHNTRTYIWDLVDLDRPALTGGTHTRRARWTITSTCIAITSTRQTTRPDFAF